MFTGFHDRLEILSRGKLPPKQTVEGFFAGESVPVNPALSRIFIQLHITEHTGRGVPKIVQAYSSDNIRFNENSITVTIPYDRLGKNVHATPQVTPQVIEWYVLDVNKGKSLLLSKYGLEVLPYDSTSNSTWSNCDLREWLNGNFLNSGFSVLEKEAILLTNIDNTKDKIFILSESEFWDLAFSQRVNQCVCTPYAVARGGRQYTEDGKQMGYWWLRIPSTNDTVTFVGQYGVLGNNYTPKWRNNICVRPALWIELNADFFTSGEQ